MNRTHLIILSGMYSDISIQKPLTTDFLFHLVKHNQHPVESDKECNKQVHLNNKLYEMCVR